MSGLAAPDASPRWGERLRWTLSDASVIAGTNLTHWVLTHWVLTHWVLTHWVLTHWVLTHWVLTHWVRNPAAVLNLTLYPIVMVVLFGYVLGSAMNVAGGGDYREFLMPGMFSQTMAMGVMTTMTVVSLQTARGVTDRYRSMPISRPGVVLGRAFADIVNSALELLILLACGLAAAAAAHDAGQHLRVAGAPAGPGVSSRAPIYRSSSPGARSSCGSGPHGAN
ncbi:ABC transporter permease [Microbispora bryophytorum]|uniref:ABC transporter permease n=1 Tax=Microbispora bryophytorum TaxID=1460882 RepID=UPI0033DAA8E7